MEKITELLTELGLDGLRTFGAMFFLCAIFVMAAAFLDMWSGVDAARTLKEPISSKGLRRTVAKIADYVRVMFFGAMVDVLGLTFPWYGYPVLTIVLTVGIIAIEGRSVIENSRRKRSHAADVIEMCRRMVNVENMADAAKLLTGIRGMGAAAAALGGLREGEKKTEETKQNTEECEK